MIQLLRSVQLILYCFLLPLLAHSQQLSGTVKDSTGAAVPYASVNLKKTSGDAILSYAIADNKGAYTLYVPANTSLGDLYLQVHSIGYKTQSQPVNTLPAKIDFILTQSASELQTVIIQSKRPVLRTHGDTLSYKVADFTNPQDRVIGDIIKRLPGISVADDGTISYNNKQVTAVYLDGDNLLDGRYNIATNSIPQGVVDKVQVIDNDQPVKLLRNKTNSNNVALNLAFKKTAKMQLFGQESIGAGTPGNYDVDLNAMLFSSKFKAINQLKANNTGYDLQRDLIQHNESDYRQLIGDDLPQSLLSLGSVNNPDLARHRYLFDKAGLVNVNNLVKLKNDWQLRINAFYLHDSQKQDDSQHTSIYLPGDTVRYTETQHNRFNPNLLHAQLNVQQNADKNYLNDALQLDDNRSISYSNLNTNGSLVNQELADHLLSFSNEFNLIRANKSNHIIQVYSYISHLAEPEKLTIEPNYQPQLFNNGIPYAQLRQDVDVPTWYTNNYLSYKIPGKLITQSFRAGFSVQSQSLSSGLGTVQTNNSNHAESDSAVNGLSWSKRKYYAEAGYDIPGNKLKGNITLPFILQQISYKDAGYTLHQQLNKLYFNPQLEMKYYMGRENFLILLYNYRNQAGTIEDIYQGNILKDYRELYSNSAELTLRQNQQAAIGFYYRRSLPMFFWTINLSYSHDHANNIASGIITNNLQKAIVLPYPNSTNSWTVSGTVSKYSYVLSTTFNGSLQWQGASSVQLQNNVLLPFNTISETAGLGAQSKINDRLNFSYQASLTQTYSRSSVEGSAYHIDQLLQKASINYNPGKIWQFKLSGEHYFTRQQGNPDLRYFFADASAKLSIKKWKIDLELDTNNLLNLKTYNALYLSANTLTASSYTLPGRIILFKVLFNL